VGSTPAAIQPLTFTVLPLSTMCGISTVGYIPIDKGHVGEVKLHLLDLH
jgi:hypothetical protein